MDGVDVVHDLTVFPWPFADGSVAEAFTSHYVEHTYPVGGPRDGLIAFMDELYRVLAPGAKVTIVHPYALSVRAFQDPTHTRFIPETTWWYFSREWRESQGLDHYPIACDFGDVQIAHGFHGDWGLRSEAAQQFAALHYWNVVTDLEVSLRAIK